MVLKKGNGNPEICLANLLNITRTEVPYSRRKGLDPKYIDKVSGQITASLKTDAAWLIQTYEPRVDLKNLKINSVSSQNGDFTIVADIGIKEMIE